MDISGSTLEGLRRRLADLESAQRATGGTACPEFWKTPASDAAGPNVAEPDAAERDAAGRGAAAWGWWGAAGRSGPGAARPGGADGASDCGGGAGPDSGSARRDNSTEGFWSPLGLDWSAWARVKGRLAPTLAFAAGITALPTLAPSSLGEADLFESVAQLGRIQHHREVVLVRLVGDIEARGLPCPGGLSRVDWLRSLDPTLTASAAKAVVTCAAAFNGPRWETLRDAVIGERSATDGEIDADTSAASASAGENRCDGAGRVTVGKAAQVIDFHARLKPVADPDDLEQAVTLLTGQASALRPEQLAQLVRELSDQVRPPKDADDHDQKRRDGRGLWFLAPNAAGMVGMTGTLDPEGAAIVKAAIDPLSAPCPLTDAGVKVEDDPRPPHQRRMDALIDIVARGVSSPGQAATTDKAKIVVTIDVDALRDSVARWGSANVTNTSTSTGGGGTATAAPTPTADSTTRTGPSSRYAHPSGAAAGRGSGTSATGDVLTPATVRRMACDAGIIPVVLGTDSQPLDVGRQERLVTRAMRTLLWLRDHGCTFPGCSMPPQWTDAHHVTHWADGGETATSNLALLCRRHHVYVHDKHLTATITDRDHVTWHTWQQWKASSNIGFGTAPPPSTRSSGP